MEHFLATCFGEQKPEVIGNDYLVLGTLDKPAWKQGTQQQMTLQEIREALHDFNDLQNYGLTNLQDHGNNDNAIHCITHRLDLHIRGIFLVQNTPLTT